jgi:hypothetical protein
MTYRGDMAPVSGQGGNVAAVVNGGLVAVPSDPGRPSMVAKVAARNPDPLTTASAPAAVEAPPAGAS